MNKTKISILLASRKNSKYLAKFLFSLMENTILPEYIEVLTMYSSEDTWNRELITQLSNHPNFKFYSESYGYGRPGLHIYFNELLQYASGEWIMYFCDDHAISHKGWDTYLYGAIKAREIDYKKIFVVAPKFDNTGSVNQMLSRGYIEALGNIGRYGNIDSYNNFVAEALPKERFFYTDIPLFHDFTADGDMMDNKYTELTNKSDKVFPAWESEEVKQMIKEDQEKLKEAIYGGL